MYFKWGNCKECEKKLDFLREKIKYQRESEK